MPTLLLFGDSIAVGLGVRDRRYAEIVASNIGFSLKDLAVSGATVEDSLALYESSSRGGDIAIIAHGVTEPIWRPSPRSLSLFPARWRRRGWMDPRAYYSSRWRKRVLERAESAIRWRLKNLVLKVPGAKEQLMTAADYESSLTTLINHLKSDGAVVILLGPPPIGEVYFPGSSSSQDEFAERASRLAAIFIPLRETLLEWDDFLLDRFHPNDAGHRRIAATITARIVSEGILTPNIGDPHA